MNRDTDPVEPTDRSDCSDTKSGRPSSCRTALADFDGATLGASRADHTETKQPSLRPEPAVKVALPPAWDAEPTSCDGHLSSGIGACFNSPVATLVRRGDRSHSPLAMESMTTASAMVKPPVSIGLLAMSLPPCRRLLDLSTSSLGRRKDPAVRLRSAPQEEVGRLCGNSAGANRGGSLYDDRLFGHFHNGLSHPQW